MAEAAVSNTVRCGFDSRRGNVKIVDVRVVRLERGEVHYPDGVRPRLTCYTQPVWWYYAAKAYHWWDMRSWRLMRALDKPLRRWHDRRYRKNPDLPLRIPLAARQDLRCYHLTSRGREILDRREGPLYPRGTRMFEFARHAHVRIARRRR